jgi:hypothetical protein
MRKVGLVELVALAALLAVAALMAACSFVASMLATNPLIEPASAARIAFARTATFGVLPVVAVGAPVYWALRDAGLARWPCVLLLGIAPGALALLSDREMGFWAVVCGATVALLTHLICREMRSEST